jgi:hypothetical protein
MLKETKLKAFLSGIPLGMLMSWSNSLREIDKGEQVINNLYVTLMFVGYFLVSIFICVLGTNTFRDRLKYPSSLFFSDTKMFVKHHLTILKRDGIHLVFYFIGAILGGLVIGS